MSRETKDEGVFETYIARKTKSIFTLPMPIIISILCVFLIVFLIFKTDNLFDIDSEDIAVVSVVHAIDRDSVIDVTQMVTDQVSEDKNSVANTTGPYTGEYKDTNAGKIFNFLKEKGLTDIAACAVIGNLCQESGGRPSNFKKNDIDPTVENKSNHLYMGMCQWDKKNRWPALIDWCNRHNLDYMSVEGQMKYMWEEMSNTKTSWRARWLKDCKSETDALTADRLKDLPDNFFKADNIKSATKAFELCYLGGVCSDKSSIHYDEGLQELKERCEYAQEAYDLFCGGK